MGSVEVSGSSSDFFGESVVSWILDIFEYYATQARFDDKAMCSGDYATPAYDFLSKYFCQVAE